MHRNNKWSSIWFHDGMRVKCPQKSQGIEQSKADWEDDMKLFSCPSYSCPTFFRLHLSSLVTAALRDVAPNRPGQGWGSCSFWGPRSRVQARECLKSTCVSTESVATGRAEPNVEVKLGNFEIKKSKLEFTKWREGPKRGWYLRSSRGM